MSIQKQIQEIRSWKTNRRDAVRNAVEFEIQQQQQHINNHTTKGDTTMKNTKLFSRLGAAMVLALLISSVQVSFANGTTAGTLISNTASVTFTDGGNVRNKNSNTVNFYVGHKVAGSFSAMANQNALENVWVNIPVSFQSTSNYGTYYSVSYLVESIGGNTFTPASYVLHEDGGTVGVFVDSTTDPVISGNQLFVEGASGTTRNFILRVKTPASANNGDSARVRLTFTNASADSAAGNRYMVNVGFTTSQNVKISIQKPVISLNVVQSAPSPATPGTPVPFSVNYSNTGSTNPSGNVTFTFAIPANMTWTGGAGPSTLTTTSTLGTAPAPGADISFTYSTGVVTFTIPNGNLNYTGFTGANATNTHTFSLGNFVKIDSANGGANPGTTITTTGTTPWPQFSYNDGTNTVNVTPNTSGATNFNVGTSYGFKFTAAAPVSPSLTAGPKEFVEYKFTVSNMGNTTNTVNFTNTHSGSSTVGDSAGTVVFASAPLAVNGSFTSNQITSLTGITKGADTTVYVRIYMRATTNGTTPVANADTYIKTIIASAQTTTGNLYYDHIAAHDNVLVTTTATTLTLYISMAIDSVNIMGTQSLYSGQNPGPGDIVTYKITVSNTAAGAVSNISISNMIPTNTTFITDAYGTGSGITIADGGTPTTTSNLTTASDGDAAQVVGSVFSTNPTTFSLASGATKIFRYRCTVN